jgi:hypothetical protein
MGSARAIKEACETLPGGQIWSIIVLLNAQSCNLSYWTVRVDIMVGLLLVIDCCVFFFFFSLLTIKVYHYPLFVCCLFGTDMGCQTQTSKVWYPCLMTDLGAGLTNPSARVWQIFWQTQVHRSGIAARLKGHGSDKAIKPMCQAQLSWVRYFCQTQVTWVYHIARPN